MSKTISLSALRVFEAAARHLSFKEAAVELNLSATAVSHQVRALEKSLGHRLFTRMFRQVDLTVEGEELARVLTPSLQSINAAVDKLGKKQRRQTVTLGTGPIFGARWLAPRLGKFWQKNPDIDLRLHHSPQPVHQQMAHYDMAIAWGSGKWNGLQSDELLKVHATPVFARGAEFIDEEITEPKALLDYPLLHNRDHTAWHQWLELMGVQSSGKLRGIIFDDANVQLQAALEGQGVALGLLPLVADEISAGRLIQPWREAVELKDSYHLLYYRDSLNKHSVSVVRDWLLDKT